MQRAAIAALGLRDGRSQFLGGLARYRDDAIAGRDQLAGDAETEAAAAAGDQDGAGTSWRAFLAIAPRQLAGRRNIERRNNTDGRRNLVARQRGAAQFQDIALDLTEFAGRAVGCGF